MQHNFVGLFLGDGRMDSPGHCAQYCSYNMMDDCSKKIMSILTLDKREVQKKSTNLERVAFSKSMAMLTQEGMNIKEVVTDQHVQITAQMSM